MRAVVVHCTCPDATTAARIATALVEEGLAACVQQVPGLRSTYRWQGRIEQSDEILLLAKTAKDRIQALVSRVQQLHPYDVPELLALPAVDGATDYLDWVVAQSRPHA